MPTIYTKVEAFEQLLKMIEEHKTRWVSSSAHSAFMKTPVLKAYFDPIRNIDFFLIASVSLNLKKPESLLEEKFYVRGEICDWAYSPLEHMM